MIGRNALRRRILKRPGVGSIGRLQQHIAACSSRTPSRRASLMCLTAAMTGMALLLAACAPALNHVRLSKAPELKPAINKPSRPTDYPQHVVYSLPDVDRVLLASELPFATENSINLFVDIYYPPDHQFKPKLPVVILVRGFSDTSVHSDKDMQQAIDWAKLIAASGMIVAVAQAGRIPMLTNDCLLDYLVCNAELLGIDASRIGFWGISAQGTPASYHAFAYSPYRDNFRVGVFLYPRLSSAPSSWPKNLSLFVVKAGKDNIIPDPTIDAYVKAARASNVPVVYTTLPDAVHGFDVYQDSPFSKKTVREALEFFKSRLLNGK